MLCPTSVIASLAEPNLIGKPGQSITDHRRSVVKRACYYSDPKRKKT